MTEVIPSTICYAAVHVRINLLSLASTFIIFFFQTYISLSSSEKWGEKWEDINLEHLYIFLREQLAEADDPWVVETLKWWNEFRRSPFYILHTLTIF